MLKLSFDLVLMIRLSVCLITIGTYQAGWSAFSVTLMVVLALASLRSLSAANEVKLIFSFVISLKVLWFLVALASYLLALPTLTLSEIRASTFSAYNTEVITFLSAQMVYVLTLLNYRVPAYGVFIRKSQQIFFWVSYGIVLLASFFINRFSFIGDSVYAGNLNVYWSGLPAIFVIFLSAWMLLNRKYGARFIMFFGFVMIYWLSTGNRSEVLIAFLTGLSFFTLATLKLKSEYSRNIAIAVLIVAGFLVFSAVGLLREAPTGASSEGLLSTILSGIIGVDRLHVSTVGASIYSALSAVDIATNSGFTYGDHFVGQFANTIPSFIPMPWDRYQDPFEQYHASYEIIGGFGLLGESYMNFGLFGPMLFSALIVLLLRALAKASGRSFLAAWCLMSFCFYSPRFFFYGYVYMHNLLTFFLVIAVIVFAMRLASGTRVRGVYE